MGTLAIGNATKKPKQFFAYCGKVTQDSSNIWQLNLNPAEYDKCTNLDRTDMSSYFSLTCKELQNVT